MSELYQEKCVACRRDSPAVTAAEIGELHPTVAEWAMLEDSGIPKLERGFSFRNFRQALAFTNVGRAGRGRGTSSPGRYGVGARGRNLVDA